MLTGYSARTVEPGGTELAPQLAPTRWEGQIESALAKLAYSTVHPAGKEYRC